MTDQQNIEEIMQRTRGYEFKDGLRDLQIGMYLILFGVTSWLTFEPSWWRFFLTMRARFGNWVSSGVWISLLFIPFIAVIAVQLLMNTLRRRWLWRDSGIVRQRSVIPIRVQIISVLLIVITISASAFMFYQGRVDDTFVMRSIIVSMGWGFAVVTYGLGRVTGLAHYLWLGLFGGIASTAIAFLPLTYGRAALVWGLLWGAALCISGTVLLRRTIQDHRSVAHDG